jgi:drug/metabolite transporter (DMT)-like permease
LSGRGLHPSNYRALFLRGLFGGISVLLYFAAIAHLPVGVATILNSSWPGFVAIFAFLFLDEPLTLRAILSLLVTALGVALVVLGDARTGLLAGTSVMLGGGALFYGLCGLLSAVFSAAAVTTVRSMRKSEGSWEIFFAFCLVGSLVTGIPGAAHFVLPTFQEALWLLAMGTCSAFAQMGMTYALRDVRAVNAGIILQLTPIATLLLGVVLFAERPTPLAWIGAILTLFGVTWGTISR